MAHRLIVHEGMNTKQKTPTHSFSSITRVSFAGLFVAIAACAVRTEGQSGSKLEDNPVECPTSAPREGEACSESSSLNCEYGECHAGTLVHASCRDHKWTLNSPEDCPSLPEAKPSACPKHTPAHGSFCVQVNTSCTYGKCENGFVTEAYCTKRHRWHVAKVSCCVLPTPDSGIDADYDGGPVSDSSVDAHPGSDSASDVRPPPSDGYLDVFPPPFFDGGPRHVVDPLADEEPSASNEESEQKQEIEK